MQNGNTIHSKLCKELSPETLKLIEGWAEGLIERTISNAHNRLSHYDRDTYKENAKSIIWKECYEAFSELSQDPYGPEYSEDQKLLLLYAAIHYLDMYKDSDEDSAIKAVDELNILEDKVTSHLVNAYCKKFNVKM